MVARPFGLRELRKTFGSVVAVDYVDLDVYDGEFLTLLGPSGSGKTTVLRMIAGFELPTAGRVELGGVDVTDRPPFDRDVNTVFQDYALFPHMSVQENVEYGLRVRKVDRRSGAIGRNLHSRASASVGTATANPANSPVVNDNASLSHVLWSTAPRCCCLTSHSAHSTSSCANRCRSSSRASSARSASPSFS